MWFFFPLTVFLIMAGIGSVMLDRRLQRRKQLAPAVPPMGSIKQAMTDFTTSGRSRIEKWRDKIMRAPSAELATRFRAWAANAPGGDASVKAWIQSLSDAGLQSFTNQLAEYCEDMGFELEWLVGHQVDKFPELAQAMSQVVWHYCQACQQAAEAQDDLEAYKQLQAFEDYPTSSHSQAFGKKFFARVVDEDLTSVTMSQYLTASPQRQAQLTVQAIHEAAAKDNEAFKRILKETVRNPQVAPQPAAMYEAPSGSQNPAAAAHSPI